MWDANWFRNKVGGRGRQTEVHPCPVPAPSCPTCLPTNPRFPPPDSFVAVLIPRAANYELLDPIFQSGFGTDFVNTQHTGNNGPVHCSSGVAFPTQLIDTMVVPGRGLINDQGGLHCSLQKLLYGVWGLGWACHSWQTGPIVLHTRFITSCNRETPDAYMGTAARR